MYRQDLARIHHEGFSHVVRGAGPFILISSALLAIARKTAPHATLRRGSVHEMDLPQCDAITAMGEVLSYMPPDGSARPSLPAFFRKASRALRPGGFLIFDLYVRTGTEPSSYRVWRAEKDWALLSEAAENPRRTKLTREVTTFVRGRGGHYRRGFERHLLQVSPPDRILASLRAAGFTARTSRRYGSFEMPRHRQVFIARKRR